jgi:hypothetical protein
MQRGGTDPLGALRVLQLFHRIGGKARHDTGPQQCAIGIGMSVALELVDAFDDILAVIVQALDLGNSRSPGAGRCT